MTKLKYEDIQTKNQPIRSLRYLLYFGAFFIASACSQNVDSVSIVRTGPPRGAIFNSDLTGATATTPVSPSLIMSIHSAGAGGLRTSGTSASLIMTSGIGVD